MSCSHELTFPVLCWWPSTPGRGQRAERQAWVYRPMAGLETGKNRLGSVIESQITRHISLLSLGQCVRMCDCVCVCALSPPFIPLCVPFSRSQNLTWRPMTRTLSWKKPLTRSHPRMPVPCTASVSWSRRRQAWRKVPRAIVAVRNSWRVRMEPQASGCVTSTPTSPTTQQGPLCPPCSSEVGRSQVAPVRSGSHSSSELGGDAGDNQLTDSHS